MNESDGSVAVLGAEVISVTRPLQESDEANYAG